jgi:MFS family permease
VSRLRGPLASRNFRLLVGCDITSMLGSAMASVAVPFAVLHSGGSATDVGFVTAASLIPTIVFLLLGGVLADRVPRQRVMVLANIGQTLAQGVFAALVLSGDARLWEMIVLTAARGCAFGFYMPASQGLLPQTVAADQLASANSVRRLSLNGAQIAGALIGGVVVGLAGPGWGLVADAGSYALAAAGRSGMRFGPLPPVTRTGILPELKDGWRTFTSHTWLWTVVAQIGVVNALFVGGFTVLGPVIANEHLGGARSWGLILAAQSIGSISGAASTIRLRPARLLLAASLVIPLLALPLFALAVPLAVPLIALASLVAGVANEVFEVYWITALQEQIPPELLSRVSAYDALGSYALGPVGTILAGPLALAIGAAAVLSAAGGVIVASTLVILCVREVRGLTRRSPDRETVKV